MCINVQLAIQGGGAKLMPLIGALEAVQDLEDSNIIRVKRIAGTSAGAIAGCIFAARIPMSTARAKFQHHLSGRIDQYFPKPGPSHMAQLLLGRPFWRTSPLQDVLTDIFQTAGVVSLKDLKLPVLVLATDLVNSGATTFETGNLIHTLLHSCAVPYCFRVWNASGGDNPVLVDGGICENLPSDFLEPFEGSDGPVVALSFKPTTARPPRNLKEFSEALLDAAINNSMNRAKVRLGKERVHEINTTIGTFDFEQALNMDNSIYLAIKTETCRFFEGFKKSYRSSSGTQRLPHSPSGYYRICAKVSRKVLDVHLPWIGDFSNKAVHQVKWEGLQNQRWLPLLTSDEYYVLIAKHSNKCLDVDRSQYENGTTVIEYPFDGTDAQKWELRNADDGYVCIIARHGEKALHCDEDGDRIYLLDFNGSDYQKWKVEPV